MTNNLGWGSAAEDADRDLSWCEALVAFALLLAAAGYFEVYMTILEFGDGLAAGLIWMFIFGPMCTAAVFSVGIMLIAGVAQFVQWSVGDKQATDD